MVFHQLSLSGAWLTSTYFSPSAIAAPGNKAAAATPAAKRTDFADSLIEVSLIGRFIILGSGALHAQPLPEKRAQSCLFCNRLQIWRIAG